MHVMHIRNAEEALILGMKTIGQRGVKRDSRNGPVLTMSEPHTTVYNQPCERVIFLPERDANPFFHFMESLWMLAGRNDVEWISRFAQNIANYSDDGVTFHGAYGYRWRNFSSVLSQSGEEVMVIDQITTIAELLLRNPDDRRIVLQMWSATSDLGMEGKDFPCNLLATFRINPQGSLDMTVMNRSNDMIWGAYGANAVHFSVLQEVLAAWIKVPVGRYWQISTNHHAYLDTWNKYNAISDLSPGFTPYELGEVRPFPIVNTDIAHWFGELEMFMDVGPALGYQDPFFKGVAIPMLQAWDAWKDKDDPNYLDNAITYAKRINALDWRKACVEWLERRRK